MSKKKKVNKNSKKKKGKLSTKRLISLYHARFLLVMKIFALCFVLLWFFTEFFTPQKRKISNVIINATAEMGLTFEHVIIQGIKNLEEDEVIELIGSKAGDPIYSLDIDNIRQRIEENQWIKLALVERRLPNKLYIAVLEKEPIAIWQFKNKLYIIDEEGNRITAKNIEKFGELIHVVGPDANVYASGLLEDLKKHPSLGKKVVSAVRYGQRRWDLNLQQKINVKMPDKDFVAAYDYLYRLDKKGKLFDQKYKVINLKDPNRYYIQKW